MDGAAKKGQTGDLAPVRLLGLDRLKSYDVGACGLDRKCACRSGGHDKFGQSPWSSP